MRAIPPIGLGTFRLAGDAVKQAVRDAVNVGYRHIDTAAIYHNEEEIGNVLKDLFNDPSRNLARSDIWITSKLSPYDMTTPRKALLASLSALQIDYLDLYLIHWPGISRKPVDSPEHRKLRIEAWKLLNEAKEEGLVRHIGISNFTTDHIRELQDETDYGIQGAFVQMEIHPWYWRDALEIMTYFKEYNLTMTGYALLAEGKLLSTDSTEILNEAEARLGISKIQIVLAWALNKRWSVLVRSTNIDHLRENIGAASLIANLTPQDYVSLDSISAPGMEEKRCWDPRPVR